MKVIFSIWFLLLSMGSILAQIPSIQWEKDYGGTSSDEASVILQTIDGNYVTVGTTSSGQSGNHSEASCGSDDIWALKLNSSGNLLNQNSIRGSLTDGSDAITEALDGGFIIAGYSNSPVSCDKTSFVSGGYDGWFVKLSADLSSIVWQKEVGGVGFDYPSYGIRNTSDNGIIACGYTTTNTKGGEDYYIVKLNSAGNPEWTKTYGGSGNDVCFDIRQTSDNGYIAIGNSSSGISGDKTAPSYGSADFWVLKLDAFGNIVWQKSYGGSDVDNGYCVIVDKNGDYILGGTSSSPVSGLKTEPLIGGSDYWILRVDPTGNIVSQKTLGGYGTDDLRQIVAGPNGGFLVGGSSESGISGDKTDFNRGPDNTSDFWIVKVDNNFKKVWDKTLGSTSDEFLRGMQATSDGGYVLNGYSNSKAGGEKSEDTWGGYDYWTVKLETDVSGISDIKKQNLNFDISPNLTSNQIIFNFSGLNGESKSIQIFNSLGESILSIGNITDRKFALSVKDFAPGIYFAQVKTANATGVRKLMVQK